MGSQRKINNNLTTVPNAMFFSFNAFIPITKVFSSIGGKLKKIKAKKSQKKEGYTKL